MLKAKKDLKELKEKIYIKQKNIMEIMYERKIDYNDLSIKKNKDEIFLLEFIYNSKKDLYDYDSKMFWKN
jgi:hypothetical protein